ncbi:hypothetical protein EC957_010912 [Mortierella hygrophila]|uniref:Uncharacterized protein n=1 Tax=Mortierella hygrophila TaxID=979708 RepID=A0A9P6K463_9FUNG|nr:hypothetical protein EC957_010912 [Mortierella hygrophila]
MTCSVGGEDPFKKLGLKPYSPIWLPSRTPSFEMMRQRSYSPNPRHGMAIRPSPVHDGDDVIGKDDRDILGFDLHEPLKEEKDKSNKKNLTTAAGKERQESGSSRLYERFGSIKKRSSPLLPDHYDDLEDYDAEEVNIQMADAKINCMSTTKQPRLDHAQDQSQPRIQLGPTTTAKAPPLPFGLTTTTATMITPTASNFMGTGGSLPRSITPILTTSHITIGVIHSSTKPSKTTTIRTTNIIITATKPTVHACRDHGPPTAETTTSIQVGSTTPEMDSILATVAMAMRGTTGFNM